MKKPIIGILTWRQGRRFEEPNYLRELIKEGHKLGSIIYLFSHNDILVKNKKIKGFIPDSGQGWKSQVFPWPDVVIDRCRKGEPGYRTLRKQKSLFKYANNPFTNKWNATRLFGHEPTLNRWVPKTIEYTPKNLLDMLKQFPILYLKPGNGTGGRSIMRITQSKDGLHLLGRSRNLHVKSATFHSPTALATAVHSWASKEKIRNGNFMIQQGLDLELISKRVADIRLLIQKDENGEWGITGLGVRVGPKHSPTSNLHNGGKPVPFEKLIRERFGEEMSSTIQEECSELAFHVVKFIENHFGNMMEFGLDIGVDVNGKVWLIEVNPKPGREIFKELGLTELYRKSIQRPIQYALHLAKDGQGEQLPIELISDPTPNKEDVPEA